ncbi:hypothetical protein MUK42_21760 [Musa troglodytarum]|uniref:Uncharacterized protein n=1 Tax=Musa troglodytarum TaxID=320322 RepID=A0A9E7KD99_9LILI|nr:hypothetical protein MUK42_21760 [Musa troglodytarum]URE12800.1 hypothetical protein MUK42_21760 [Musa troglodytarum]URE12801.1 hypothetical protein MUK42_21760 [Musa troglodytarum]
MDLLDRVSSDRVVLDRFGSARVGSGRPLSSSPLSLRLDSLRVEVWERASNGVDEERGSDPKSPLRALLHSLRHPSLPSTRHSHHHHLLLGLRFGAAPVPSHSTDSALMLLRLSMPLILAGSVTFVIGFMLIPWVLEMLTVFYLAGIVSNLSVLGRAILFPSSLFGPLVVKDQLLSELPMD